MRPASRPFIVVFFAAIAVIGYFTLDDYGISWDESIQRRHGRVSIDYAAEKLGLEHERLEPDYHLEDYQWSNYGMLYQITASLLEFELGLEESPYHYYRLRHAINFTLYWLALLAYYRILRFRWPTKAWFPLLGTVMLVVSPRIYGHAFFNPKDHILLVFYVYATLSLLYFLKRRNWPTLLLHALITALALNTRLPALFILLLTVGLLLWETLFYPVRRVRHLAFAGVYTVLSFALMVPFFPYLWEDTLSRLAGAFLEMSNFDWSGAVLLFGDRLSALDLPAYYIPAWIVITTPVVYVLLMLTGIVNVGARSLVQSVNARPYRNYGEQADIVHLGLSVGPILAVIVLGSTLYNGWRHLHFVYPALVYLALRGFVWWESRYAMVSRVALGSTIIITAVTMVVIHPHQPVYFNYLIHGNPLMARFDMDYWGLGYRQALTELAEQIPAGEKRRIKCANWPCIDNVFALPPHLRDRLELAWGLEEGTYYVTNFLYADHGLVHRGEGRYTEPVVLVAPRGDLIVGIYKQQK